jgi:amino acid adenylation domain-containing protein
MSRRTSAIGGQGALWRGFLDSAGRFPDWPALTADGETLTYAELRDRASRIAATLQARSPDAQPRLTGVFGYRSPTAFAGVLGALLAGHGYVPLNQTFPIARTRLMLERSTAESLVVDAASSAQLHDLLDEVDRSLVVLLPDTDDVGGLKARWPNHTIVGSKELEPATRWHQPPVDPEALAYLLFTSGSTGAPKGVMVAQRNVVAFVDYIAERYDVRETDRLSQMFELTFDLSVFDMFVAWERGAWLCCPSQRALINPGKFIKEMELTTWFSTPSTAVFMKRLQMLKPDSYPSLRVSLFCGEQLPTASAAAWAQAAPNSIVENLYGPTELTIACTLYRWETDRTEAESELGVVPIGDPFPGMNVLVVDEELEEVPPGEDGELLMNGPQMSLGYWREPEKTASAFIVPPGRTDVYYRTGDRVRRPGNGRPMTHLGRVDFQVKIRGHRVELGEIEAVVRAATGLDGVVAVGWPRRESGFDGVEVFVEGEHRDLDTLRATISTTLPDYMVPRRFHFMDRLPQNANSKFDRVALMKLLEEGA